MAKEYIIGQEYLDSQNQKKTAYFKDAEAVSTTEVQELTYVQKRTARKNIGASSLTDLQIIMSQLVDLRTKDNFITKNLGYKGTVMAHGEAQALQPVTSGDASIAWVVFTYGDENSPSTAMIHQKHEETITVQTIFFGNKVASRTITFTDNTRTSVESVTAWSTVTNLFGVQATQNNVVLRLMNSHLDGSQGLYMLTLPALTSTASGVITPSQFASLVNGGDYDSNSKSIRLKHDNTVLASIDATAFIKDGMVSNVTIRNGQLVIVFNTDAGKEDIRIPLTEIFNPDNYYTKTEINNLIEGNDKVYVDDTVAIHHLPEGEIVGDVKEALMAFRHAAAGGKSLAVFKHGTSTGIVATVESWGSSFEMWFFYNGKFCRVTADPSDELWEAHWVDLENAVQPDDEDYIELQDKVAELDETAVRTGSYDGTVAVGLADNLRGDSVVDAEFYKRKTGGTQSVGSGIAAIKEVRGKSIVWNQLVVNGDFNNGTTGWSSTRGQLSASNNKLTLTVIAGSGEEITLIERGLSGAVGHKCYATTTVTSPKAIMPLLQLGDGEYEYREVPANTKTILKILYNIRSSGSANYFRWNFNYGIKLLEVGDVLTIEDCQLIDLTLMFGAGNEPATVEEFEKMFPLDYYDYNAGEVIPFAGQNLVTTGKNQYNPATGKANLLGGKTYQLLGTYTSATIDEVAVTLDSNNCFTTTKDCVLDITGGNNTDTFVGLYNGETNTYEPYEKHTLPLDPSQWRDKDGNLVYPYGGMHGVGTAYDYAKVDADGYIRKAVRCFGQVDLGTLTYSVNGIRFSTEVPGMKLSASGWATDVLAISPKFVWANGVDTGSAGLGKMGCNTFNTYFGYNAESVEVFKTAMNGVPLIYELAEPIEVELATPIYAKYLVDKDGTEEISPANGAEPYTTPANLSILYAMDARGEIKNLPKNYLSKESAENMLNAMKSAGVIASYTMTYSNGQYIFTFTKPSA